MSGRRNRRKVDRSARPRLRPSRFVVAVGLLALLCSCTTTAPNRRLNLRPTEFRSALRQRVPEVSEALAAPPFEVDHATIRRALAVIEREPLGPPRVQALVRFLTQPEPKGLGIAYDWSVTATAATTLERRRGNCFALASVLVGLGRGLGWPIYYAEATPRELETRQFEDVRAVSDHMIVIIVAKTVQMYVDFTGLIRNGRYDVRPIADIKAYAHLINNMAGQRVMHADRPASEEDWHVALDGFELATRIEPTLGRAWNNLGIVYRHLGRIDDAREAYHRALAIDSGFRSAEHNLQLMETRAEGGPSVVESAIGRP